MVATPPGAKLNNTLTETSRRYDRPEDSEVASWVLEYVRRSREEDRKTNPSASLSELKARIAQAHSALVESIARRFLASGEPLDDLVQEGYLGLLSALDNYNPGHGQATGGKSVKFSTYATHFVAGAIRHFLRDRGKIIKEPAWLHEVSSKVNRTRDLLTQKLGRAPENLEIAQSLNLTEEAVAEIVMTRQTFQVAAFDAPSDSDDGLALGLIDPEKIKSDKYVTLQLPIEDRIVLENAMVKLKALEQHVLREFFYQDLSQTEIARKFGISCNYVSHILKNSTGKLKRILGEAEVRDRSRTRESSIHDPVSGLFNGEHFLRRAEEELNRMARAGQSAAFLYLRIEGLPQGGMRREEAWSICGATVRKAVRKVDLAGRQENDAILLFLPQTGEDAAHAVAAHLTDLILMAGIAAGDCWVVNSGVVQYPKESRSLREIVSLAKARAN